MKRIIVLLCFVGMTMHTFAQRSGRFDPKKFQVELEQYIVTEAALTIQESAIFFPIYREMRKKQQGKFGQMKRYRFVDASDDKAAKDAIEQRDLLEIQMKQLIQEYHRRLMEVLPAGKVLKIIKAEDKFHRQSFKQMAKKGKWADNK
ncbi:MAG: hypothetical protein SO013_08040 [Prevotella sp.]|nr:hypothetical protein [Prevotella sp.]